MEVCNNLVPNFLSQHHVVSSYKYLENALLTHKHPQITTLSIPYCLLDRITIMNNNIKNSRISISTEPVVTIPRSSKKQTSPYELPTA